MSETLASLAADLAYAAEAGARHIAATVNASAKLEAQTGVHLTLPGPGIAQAGREQQVSTPVVQPAELVEHGAAQAADDGAQLVRGHR